MLRKTLPHLPCLLMSVWNLSPPRSPEQRLIIKHHLSAKKKTQITWPVRTGPLDPFIQSQHFFSPPEFLRLFFLSSQNSLVLFKVSLRNKIQSKIVALGHKSRCLNSLCLVEATGALNHSGKTLLNSGIKVLQDSMCWHKDYIL